MWPFKRKPKHIGPNTVDWQPGDMAEVLPGVMWPVIGPKPGEKVMVMNVDYGVSVSGLEKAFFLRVAGYQGGWFCTAFRKITLTETGADRKVGKRKPAGVSA